MPGRKKLAVAVSVLATGASAALFFRKDASPFWFRQDAASNPFFEHIERRAGAEQTWTPGPAAGPAATPPRPADYVMPATAAIVQPGNTGGSQPLYRRSTGAGVSLLEPIEGVTPNDDTAGDTPRDLPAPAAASDASLTHRIVDGDTLSRLASQYLGGAEHYMELYAYNRDVLSNPDLLPIGKVIKIPPRAGGNGASLRRRPDDDESSLRLVPLGPQAAAR
jgi:hypothetical protein